MTLRRVGSSPFFPPIILTKSTQYVYHSALIPSTLQKAPNLLMLGSFLDPKYLFPHFPLYSHTCTQSQQDRAQGTGSLLR